MRVENRRRLECVISGRGHRDITAFDSSRIVITKAKRPWDDSVIAVAADKSAAELPEELKTALCENKRLVVTISVADAEDTVIAYGSFGLKLTDPRNIVLSRTAFAEPGTVGLNANKGARDLSRELTQLLRVPGQDVRIKLSVL